MDSIDHICVLQMDLLDIFAQVKGGGVYSPRRLPQLRVPCEYALTSILLNGDVRTVQTARSINTAFLPMYQVVRQCGTGVVFA